MRRKNLKRNLNYNLSPKKILLSKSKNSKILLSRWLTIVNFINQLILINYLITLF